MGQTKLDRPNGDRRFGIEDFCYTRCPKGVATDSRRGTVALEKVLSLVDGNVSRRKSIFVSTWFGVMVRLTSMEMQNCDLRVEQVQGRFCSERGDSVTPEL